VWERGVGEKGGGERARGDEKTRRRGGERGMGEKGHGEIRCVSALCRCNAGQCTLGPPHTLLLPLTPITLTVELLTAR
jgi:hypothetical protein